MNLLFHKVFFKVCQDNHHYQQQHPKEEMYQKILIFIYHKNQLNIDS